MVFPFNFSFCTTAWTDMRLLEIGHLLKRRPVMLEPFGVRWSWRD